MFWFFAWPHLKDFWQIQSCQIQIKQLQFLLGKARLEAVMGRQRQKILPLAQGDWLIGNRIFKSQHRLYWHGFNSLNQIVFESKLPLNHVNGYFIYQCTTILNYRLWLNRLGHIRVEQYGHGIYTMP